MANRSWQRLLDDAVPAVRLCALLLVVSGCTITGTGVALTVTGQGLSVDALQIVASFAGRKSTATRSLPAPIKLPSTVLAVLPDQDLTVSFDVTGTLAGQMVGHGHSGNIQVAAHHIVDASVDLGGVVPGPGGDGSDLAVAEGGGVVDLGGGWIVQHFVPGPGVVTSIWGASAFDLYATCKGCGSVNMLRSTDGGTSWVGINVLEMGTLAPNGIWGADSSTVLVVGDNGRTLRGADGAFAPIANPSLPGTQLLGIWGVSVSDVFAVGSAGASLHYSGGWSVTPYPPVPMGTTFYDVWGSSATDVYAVGVGGAIAHTANRGTSSWTASSTGGVANDLYGIWGASAGDIYAVGASGTVLRWTGAASWSQATSFTQLNLYGVWGSSSTDVYVVAANGLIYHSTDHGVTWVMERSNSTVDLKRVWGLSASEVWAVGAAQTILRKP